MVEETTLNILERAEQANKKGEEIAKRIEEANKRAEELMTRSIMGGQSTMAPIPSVKVETSKEYAERVMSGKK